VEKYETHIYVQATSSSVVRVFDITEQCFEISKVVNWHTFPNCYF